MAVKDAKASATAAPVCGSRSRVVSCMGVTSVVLVSLLVVGWSVPVWRAMDVASDTGPLVGGRSDGSDKTKRPRIPGVGFRGLGGAG
jgi:hypothetical protein